MLQRWGAKTLHGCSAFTSNVDGQFQRAGFEPDTVTECHGTIHHLQCTVPCSDATWPADDFVPEVDEESCTLLNALPLCPRCRALARPNVLMFGDPAWIDLQSATREAALGWWLDRASRVVVVEIGGGTAIPSVRHFSHRAVIDRDARLIRINPNEPGVPTPRDVSIAAPALRALQAIERLLDPSAATS